MGVLLFHLRFILHCFFIFDWRSGLLVNSSMVLDNFGYIMLQFDTSALTWTL